MRKKILLLLSICLIVSPVVLADWDESMPYKWVQYPDLTPTGIDVNGTAFKLADDFLCTVTGPLTDFHIWCSWLYDEYGQDPSLVDFVIEIYDDIPADQNPDGYSKPGNLLWTRSFAAGDFAVRVWQDQIIEGWWDPGTDFYILPGDTICWQYNFVLNPQDPDLFIQEGSVDNPVVYWIAVQARPVEPGPLWGWKTTLDHWNDDAVYDDGFGNWKELIYPAGHELFGSSIDLAFVITGEEQIPDELDWGDAPDNAAALGYPTLSVNNGANHVITAVGPWLGDASDTPDAEPDGQPDATATGDDNDGNDDEDGVQIPVLTIGQTSTITFEVNSSDGNGGTVSAWIDYDGDKVWGSMASEQIIAASYPNGVYNVNVTPPTGTVVGQTFARFRITRDSAAIGSPTGPASDGEVEDYEVILEEEPTEKLKFQQLPLDGVLIDQFQYWGHDELSTAWRDPEDTSLPPELFQGCYMADDFADLEHSPVIKLRWWGSYLENFYDPPSIQVDRFLIAFEKDVPAGTDTDYSHPGEVLLTQFVVRDVDGALTSGEFSETMKSAGGPPCGEMLFEYEAVLENPFPQDPNTVYWLKIVAMVEAAPGQLVAVKQCGIPLCELGRQPWSVITQNCTVLQQYPPLIRWGWHNRDYTRMDPYASTPPAVVPGEYPTLFTTPAGTDIEIWHFQDDAVSGDVFIDEADPVMPFVDQPNWFEEYYKFIWALCPDALQGVDGPEGIDQYSKDLAFELWTTTLPADKDFGDAPEGGIAYPATGVIGGFPTCVTAGPAGWIQHTNFGAYFGPMVDFEFDGNAGTCPTCFPLYDQDECFADGDAGLIVPDSYTIDSTNKIVQCVTTTPGAYLGRRPCQPAVWGTNIDIYVTNFMPSQTVGYVNVLIDWNQDGVWSGSSICPTGGAVPEHVLVDFPIPNGYSGPLSGLTPPGFTMGPNSGFVWMRFSITERPVGTSDWDGSGSFEDGETEDYLTRVFPTCVDFNLTKIEGGTDDTVNASDIGSLINYINTYKGMFFSVPPTDPNYDPTYNFDVPGTAINASDIGAMINFINTYKGLFFSVNCLTCGC